MSDRESETVGFGIVGCGIIARNHAAAIEAVPGAKLVAVSDVIEERAHAFAQQHGAAHVFSRYQDLMERDDVDVVSVCTPSGSHSAVAQAASHAAKHVLCEKPLDVTSDAMSAMIAAAERAGTTLATVYQRRVTAGARRVKEAVERGDLGRLVLAGAELKYYRAQTYYDSADWRGTWDWDGGGVLMNQGIHGIDLLQWLAGDIAEVAAQVSTLARQIPVEDTAVATLQFANGALGTVAGTTSAYPELPTRLGLHGTEGAILFSDAGVEHWTARREDQTAAMREGVAMSFAMTHRPFIQNMVDVVRRGAPPLVSAREGRKAVDVILAIYQSARSGGQVVRVPPSPS